MLVIAVGSWSLVALLTAEQLSTADQVASVFAAVVGLPIAGYGLFAARRPPAPSGPAAGGRVRQDVSAGRDAYVAGRDLHVEDGSHPR